MAATYFVDRATSSDFIIAPQTIYGALTASIIETLYRKIHRETRFAATTTYWVAATSSAIESVLLPLSSSISLGYMSDMRPPFSLQER